MEETTEPENPFAIFIGKEVKVPYRDGGQFKIARGKLESANYGFLKINGRLGVLLVNISNVERCSEVTKGDKDDEQN